MRRRSLLKSTVAIFGSGTFAGCLTPFQSKPSRAEGITPHMGFFAVTPATEPLVIDGLNGDDTDEVWGQLFLSRPETDVFTERIEEESPYMVNHVFDNRYDERFNVLLQMRFSEPTILARVSPYPIEQIDSNRVRILLQPQPTNNSSKEPSKELQMADSVVATTLLIYKYQTEPPRSVVLSIQGSNGEILTEIIAK